MDFVLGARQRPLTADVWTELRDWLTTHSIEVPEGLAGNTDLGADYRRYLFLTRPLRLVCSNFSYWRSNT
ncbi:MAG: hypothetical protein AAF922_07835 [Pseudomonadota bacterium]